MKFQRSDGPAAVCSRKEKQCTQKAESDYIKCDLCHSNVVCSRLVSLFHFVFSPFMPTYSFIADESDIMVKPHKVSLSFLHCVCLPWDVFVGSYCHTAVFIPGCFSFRVTAQCLVLQTAKQRTVNIDWRFTKASSRTVCVFYTAVRVCLC